uniref:Uncharacterized protein n=1 Tax=Chelydra serpentina TaxID=8475 RepID=A0A8C3TKT3_CHESE
ITIEASFRALEAFISPSAVIGGWGDCSTATLTSALLRVAAWPSERGSWRAVAGGQSPALKAESPLAQRMVWYYHPYCCAAGLGPQSAAAALRPPSSEGSTEVRVQYCDPPKITWQFPFGSGPPI